MPTTVSSSLISKLKEFQSRKKEEQEVCNFCGKPIPSDHRHLMDVATRRFFCTCEMCAILQSVHGGYRMLPQRYEFLKDFEMSDELWSEFLIPVNMAFFVFQEAEKGIVAYYPAPTGATESKLKMEAWKKLEQLNPVLNSLSPEVEALLVNRLNDQSEYYIVPIDNCYKLIGIIRSNWKGIFGGREVLDATRNFFYDLKNKTPDA